MALISHQNVENYTGANAARKVGAGSVVVTGKCPRADACAASRTRHG